MTFMSWLHEQEDRSDLVGTFAQYWRDLDQRPRLSAPESMRKHLVQRGLFSGEKAVPGLAEAYDATLAEYRQQRILQDAAQAGIAPEQAQAALEASVARHPSNTLNPVMAEEFATLHHKLDLLLTGMAALCQAAGVSLIEAAAGGRHARDGGAEPDWDAIYAAADFREEQP